MADEKEEMQLCEESFQVFSPPKPTRIIQIETPMVSQKTSSANCTSSLPALAGEVALAQKKQINRLEKRMEFLQKAKDDYYEVLQRMTFAERDMHAVSRKSTLLQDDIDLCQTNCEKIQKEIDVLVGETEALRRDIKLAEVELAMNKKNNEEYRKKMKNHKELVDEFESFNKVNKNIEAETSEMDMLKNEKKSLAEDTDFEKFLSGEVKEITIAALFALEETKHELEENLKKNHQPDEEDAKQAKLRREIELLQKKYQAQLTWTRKQLQETTTRNKQWSEEARQKEREIRQIRAKINQY